MNKNQLPLFPEDYPIGHVRRTGKIAGGTADTKYVSSIWVFPDQNEYQLYRWYGTLPTPLVERLIGLFAKNADCTVLDPFMGTGVTLDVAGKKGLKAIGADNNPLACLIAESRLAPIAIEKDVSSIVDKISNKMSALISNPYEYDDREWRGCLSQRSYDYTRKWFRKDTLNAVMTLFFKIAEVEDETVQRLLFVAAAQVVRDVANVDPRCTHHLVTKKKDYINPIPLFRERINQNLAKNREASANTSKISISQSSVFDLPLEKNSADFVLIHPPYLGVIHYPLIHRLATDVLDIVNKIRAPMTLKKYNFDYLGIKKTDASTDNTEEYRNFGKKLVEVVQKVLAPDGHCALIVGDQRYRGYLRHPFTDFVQYFEERGFVLAENFIWILQNQAGMHILRRGHFIDHNYISIFRKKPAAKGR